MPLSQHEVIGINTETRIFSWGHKVCDTHHLHSRSPLVYCPLNDVASDSLLTTNGKIKLKIQRWEGLWCSRRFLLQWIVEETEVEHMLWLRSHGVFETSCIALEPSLSQDSWVHMSNSPACAVGFPQSPACVLPLWSFFRVKLWVHLSLSILPFGNLFTPFASNIFSMPTFPKDSFLALNLTNHHSSWKTTKALHTPSYPTFSLPLAILAHFHPSQLCAFFLSNWFFPHPTCWSLT